MNNPRLLTWLLCVTALSGGVCAVAQKPVVITLDEIFQTAESNSVQLRPSLSSDEEALCDISVARSGLLPDINASLSVSYIGDGFTTKRNLTDYQKATIPHFGNGLSINITQPVFTGGAVSGAIELAGLKSTASRYATDFKRDNIRFQLTGFYLDLYKCTNLRKVVESNIERARLVLEEMRVRYEHGVALQNDITRYELLLSGLELQLVKINNTIDILNNNIVVTAGMPDETVIIPDSTILSRSLPVVGEEWWQNEAATCSPSLQLARSSVEMSRKSEKIVRAGRLPKIGLQAGWNIDGPILVEVPPINRNLSYWYVGIGVSYDISSLYKNNRSLSKSKIATRRSVEELDAARENLELTIRGDYIHYLEAYEELKTSEKAVELAERNYSTTSTRYSADMALITDMLDAANSCLEAGQQLVNARINIIYYYYKLLFTSGKI